MSFDQPDRCGVDPGILPGTFDCALLTAGVGSSDALALAIRAAADTADHRVDLISIALGVIKAFQEENDRAFSHHKAVRAICIRAGAIRAERADLAEFNVGFRAHAVINPAGNSCIEFSAEQPIRGSLDGSQRRGAGSVGDEIGSGQIENVGHPPGDDIRELTRHGIFGDRQDARADLGGHLLEDGGSLVRG